MCPKEIKFLKQFVTPCCVIFVLFFYNGHLGILFFRIQSVVESFKNFKFEPFRHFSAEKVIVTAAFAIFEVLTRFCRVQNDFYAIKLF